MHLLTEDLVRAQMSERVGQTRHLGHGQQLVAARRKVRRAERAALQARLVLARSL